MFLFENEVVEDRLALQIALLGSSTHRIQAFVVLATEAIFEVAAILQMTAQRIVEVTLLLLAVWLVVIEG